MVHFYQFRITFKQQLKLFIRVPFLWIIIILIWLFFLHMSLSDIAFLIISLLIFTLDTLPTIAVHLQYWKVNHNAVLSIDTNTRKLFFQTPERNLEYSFDDIQVLHYYYSYAKGSQHFSFGDYRYYKIIFRDSTEIIITCLMVNHIEYIIEMLLGIKAGQHSQLICLLN